MTFVPELPREVWTVQAATFVTWLGNGAVGPFVLVYLHDARGIPVGTAGLVLSAAGAGALAAGPVSGSVADRLGARAVLRISRATPAKLHAGTTRCCAWTGARFRSCGVLGVACAASGSSATVDR